MKKEFLKIGQHIWLKETDCCGGYHKKGEEGVIMNIDGPHSFFVESVITGSGFWHELKCVSKHEDYFEDNLFEI